MRLILALVAAQFLLACEFDDDADAFSFERLNPDALNPHPAFSHVTVVSGDSKFITVAGQTDVALDHVPGANDCRHDDWRGQLLGVNENIGVALAAVGATWDDVTFVRRFVLDITEYLNVQADTENPLPAPWQTRPPPPSTLIEVNALAESCFLLEIDVFAAIAEEN